MEALSECLRVVEQVTEYPPLSSLVIERPPAHFPKLELERAPALQAQLAERPVAPRQVALWMGEDLGRSRSQGGYGQRRPRRRDTTTAAAASLRKPAHRLNKR